MKKSASVLLVLGAAILGVACNPPRVAPAIDTGANDAGTIILPDGGGRDTGARMDTGARRDTGGGGGGCSLTVEAGNFGSLSAGCLPRCAASTLTAINACPMDDDGTCLNAALDGDSTASIAWTINGMAAMNPLDCGQCFGNQQIHCLSASGCGSEVDAYIACASMAGMPTCTTEVNALNACGMANQAAYGDCANDATMGIVACFGG